MSLDEIMYKQQTQTQAQMSTIGGYTFRSIDGAERKVRECVSTRPPDGGSASLQPETIEHFHKSNFRCAINREPLRRGHSYLI